MFNSDDNFDNASFAKPDFVPSLFIEVNKISPAPRFSTSLDRGTPAEFGVTQVIKGWTEGLQLMKKGAKYKFFIPQELAYGQQQRGKEIKPFSMLIFEVELLEVLDK